MEFEALVAERRKVQEMCQRHARSLEPFKYRFGASFRVLRNSPERGEGGLHHITTTATCIESLEDCHPTFWPKEVFANVGGSQTSVVKKLMADFYAGASARDWLSEDSAPIYCAVRALPLFLRSKNEWTQVHVGLITKVYEQLADPERFGIGEEVTRPKADDPKWYPEHSYHTYWALRVLDLLHEQFPSQVTVVPELPGSFRAKLRLWARAKLGEEIALHSAESAALDSDQLTWALTSFLEFEGDLSSSLRGQDLVRKGFEALATTQEGIGRWRHYRPLFVYSNVGNAYCYVYESFAYLLRVLLKRMDKEDFLEGIARQFVDRLRELRKYAEITQVANDRPGCVAWSSGHRPANPEPESWATASVFSFFQVYRRLLGVLARRDSLRSLPRPQMTKSDPLKKIAERGATWPPSGRNSVAEDLVTLFVNPVIMNGDGGRMDPDDQLIADDQARSAILFGPPGASKTTLAQNLAACLNWEYVELHSSHFVAEGVQAVQRTADRIFNLLKELDRTVVLFDEPDELVREREGAADAFGRFLTTSMLPKLAELWKQRRLLYFIATNHIRYFDAAITRSERFDVLVFVSQPSFARKIEQLEKCLKKLGIDVAEVAVKKEQIDDHLSALENLRRLAHPPHDVDLPEEWQLAKFVLLRWDQIEELACRLGSLDDARAQSIKITATNLSLALQRITDRRLSKLQAYFSYLDDITYSRRDFQRKPVYEVVDPSADDLPQELLGCHLLSKSNGKLWLACPTGQIPERLSRCDIEKSGAPGQVRLKLLPGSD